MYTEQSTTARAFDVGSRGHKGLSIFAVLVYLATFVVAIAAPASAYQVATSAPTVAGGVGTLTMPGSGLAASVSASGLTSVTGGTTLGGRGYVASDYTPGLATTTPAVNVLTDATNNCPSVGTCSGLGTVTITFSQPVTNPVLSLAGIGGEVHHLDSSNVVTAISQLHDILTLTTPGVTLTDLSGGNLAVSGTQITANNASTGYRCETTAQTDGPTGTTLPSAGATAACGSVRINGTVTSVTFSVSAIFTQTTASVPPYTNNTSSDPTHNADGFAIAVTAPEDFGDSPSSYDQGNAARAVLSDVQLGPSVTEDNATVANGTVSPNASATAALDGADNGVTLGPLSTSMTSYSTTVAISGASKPGTACGWIDFTKNGVFDTGERACAAFAAGATSATLTWSGLSGLTAGNTYARFRVGYNAAQTQSPIGASDAGEVEDYLLAVAGPAPFACTTPTVFDAAGTPNTQLFAQTQTPTGSTFTAVGPPWAGGVYNAIGFDSASRLMYAVSGAQLLIIDSTGAVTNTGVISGLPATPNVVVGAIDASGNYYIEDVNSGNIYQVNVATRVATLVMNNPFLNMFDFTFANGYLWGLNQPASGAMVMVRIDPVNKVVSSFSMASLGLPFDRYGAAWTYGNGNLGFDRNSGGVFQIAVTNPSAAAPTFSLVASGSGPASTANDGTSCVPGPVDLSIAKTGPATVLPSGQVTWTLTVTNNGPNISSGYVVNDQVPAGYTNVSSSTPGCTVTGNSVQCLGGVLGVGASATITLTANAPPTNGCLTNTASVLGNESDPTASNDTSAHTTCVASNPALTLTKSAAITTDANNDGKAGVGDVITFSFAVKNTGDVTMSAITIADQLVAPAGPAVSVTCPPGSLAPGATVVCTSSPYTVTQADVNAGSVANSATASGTPPTGPPVTTPPSTTTTPTPSTTGLSLVKSAAITTDANNDGKAGVGDVITFSFAVKNTGDVTMSAIAIADQLVAPAGPAVSVTCPATVLAPGASMTCTSSPYTVTQADVDAGSVTNTATASGTPPTGPPVTTPPSTTTTPTPSGATLSLTKSAALTTDANNDGKAGVGDVITFSFLVTNMGSVTMHNVSVADQLVAPSGPAVSVTCPPGSLAPGATVVCTSSPYTVTQADVNAGSVANSATASGTPPTGPPVTTPPSTTTTPTPTTTGLSLVKSAAITTDANNDGKAGIGDVITFSFVVKNTGDVTMTGIAVADQLVAPAGPAVSVTCPATVLTPGESMTCTSSPYVVTQADVDAGSVANTATASGTPPTGPPVTTPPSTTTTPTPNGATLSLTKSAALTTDANNDGKAGVGDVITFSFAVTNTGDVTISGIAVADQLVAPAGPAVSVTCPAAVLAPGASMTCTSSPYVVAQADVDAGSVANTATASGTPPTGPPVTTPPSTTTTPTPNGATLSLTKSAAITTDANNDGKAGIGDVITFSFAVTNTGDVTMTGIAIADQLVAPAGPAVSVTCPGTTLAPAASMTCTSSPYVVTQADVDAGSVANTATASGTPPTGPPVTTPPSTTTTPTPNGATLSLTKSAALTTDANNDGKAGVGDVITFSFAVTNTGDVTISGIAVADQLVAPAGPAVSVTCPAAVLAPGASMTCTSSPYVVAQADVDAGSVANTATASGTPPTGPPVTTPPSTTTTPTPNGATLSLTKSAAITTDANNDGKAGIGDVITFSFLVTNTGSVTMHNVSVADQLVAPAGPAVSVTCPATVLAPGESMTCTSSPYVVTQADVDAGSVANSATASGTPPTGPPVTTPPSTTTTPTPTTTGLSLTKSAALTTDANNDGKAGVGDVITFSFLVTNTGSVTMHNVSVADLLVAPAGPAVSVTCPGTTLAPAASMTCTSSPYVVTQADVDAGSVANTATASGTPPTGPPVTTPPSTTTTPTPTTTGLSLTKSAVLTTDANNDGKAGVGDVITFSFVVQNAGDVTISGIAVADQLVAPAGPAVSVTCPGTTLAPAASMTCTSSPYTVTQADVDAGSVANSATASGTPPTGPPVTTPPSTTTTPTPTTTGLSLTKSAALTTDANNDGKAGVGDAITFSFLVTNTGSVTMHNVSVADQLVAPAGPAVSVSCPGTTLAPGASMTCTSSGYTVTQADVNAGSVANSATASGTPPTGPPVTTPPSTTTTPALIDPGLSLDKKVSAISDANHNHLTDVGDTIQWTFAVRNTGNVTLRGVAINDGLLTDAGIVVSCPKSTLAPAEAMTCASAAYTITQADADAGHVANTAVSRGTTPHGTPVVSPPDSTLTPVVSDPPANSAIGTVLAFTGVSPGLFMAGLVGLVALLMGLLLVWIGRRPQGAGKHRS
ncbi:DUF11 domain-containing protein [Nostocoides sp. HKS02]|uniref:DUF11 domain-containing protein n=1 Tax=Nostocoides sp. HKS02 TaxID=1813880 RepID=UPI0012B4B2DD|nr:DUF11 domain-containing protein [Tetrasphaera sp. HKS02]QGN58973.1 DUF11 domain-containing protein [Tetrasphaera sp. HKS02]